MVSEPSGLPDSVSISLSCCAEPLWSATCGPATDCARQCSAQCEVDAECTHVATTSADYMQGLENRNAKAKTMGELWLAHEACCTAQQTRPRQDW